MSTHKRRLPKFARVLLPSLIILAWVTIGAFGGPFFGKISEVASNDQSTFLPASAESTQVNDEIKKFQDENSIPAIIVFTDENKNLSEEKLQEIESATAEIKGISGVIGDIPPPIASDNDKAALVVVETASDAENESIVADIRETLEQSNLSTDYKVTGPVGFLEDLGEAFAGIDGLLLAVALAVVFVILLVVYRSPILPFLVLINSVFALCASILIVYYLAKFGVVTLNGQVQGILFILVIGAATDYALLFVARYREELTKHKETYQATLASWRRSLEPIAAAGGTVIAGLLCLLLSDLNSNKALGPVGAIGIAMAITATLTFLPSLLLVFGRKVFWPRVPEYIQNENKRQKLHQKLNGSIWTKVANFVTSRPRIIWITTTAVLLVMTLGLTQLRADGVPQSEFILGKSEAREGQQIINQHFPGGAGTPVQIVISRDKINQAVAQLEADEGVDSVSAVANNSPSGTVPLGNEADNIKQQIKDSIGDNPQAERIAAAAYPFKDAEPKAVDGKVLLEATLNYNADSEAAQATIERLRSSLDSVDPTAQVGGTSAVQLDTLKSAEHDRAVVIPAVLAVITIILMVLLRSILAPLLLLATTVLSFAAILGVSALVFNDLFNFPGADPSVVLYGFIFLVALGIDYNIFLMTRVREESLQHGTRKGVIIGLIATGSVITSAGIVLAATFAALAVIPILFLVQLAFIVSLGVLIDTIVIRSILVPALTYDIGKAVWWPSRKHKD